MRRRKGDGRCVFAAVLLFFGLVALCFISWRFLLFLIAAIFITIGIVLIHKC